MTDRVSRSRGARAQLASLAGQGGPGGLRWGSPPPSGRAVRRSAVLLLFGLLEESDHGAHGRPDVDVLLIRRAPGLRHHPGQIAFPGGGLDPGEGPAAAALREAVEETGIAAAGVTVLGTLPALPLAASGNHVSPVLAWWDAPSPLTVDGTETAAAFRVPVAQLLHPGNRGIVRVQRPGPTSREVTTPAFAVAGHVVWGFTAHVLDGVFDALGWAVPWDRRRQITLPAVSPTVGTAGTGSGNGP